MQVPKGVFVALADFSEPGMAFLPTEASVRDAVHNSVIDGARRWMPHPEFRSVQ
jgi:hypothetical protein